MQASQFSFINNGAKIKCIIYADNFMQKMAIFIRIYLCQGRNFSKRSIYCWVRVTLLGCSMTEWKFTFIKTSIYWTTSSELLLFKWFTFSCVDTRRNFHFISRHIQLANHFKPPIVMRNSKLKEFLIWSCYLICQPHNLKKWSWVHTL